MMKKLIVECIGTFFLVLTVALTGNPIAIGFVLVALVYMGGYISGAHYNPAVTFGLWILKKIDTETARRYVAVQMLGGFAAAAVYYFVKQDVFSPGIGVGVNMPMAFLVEVLFTFLLVSVVCHVAATEKTKGNQYYGLAIGMALLAGAFAGGNISGGVYNPAVGVSPLIFDVTHSQAHFGLILLYMVGPLAGGGLAGLAYRKLK
jgi:aquaporin Z